MIPFITQVERMVKPCGACGYRALCGIRCAAGWAVVCARCCQLRVPHMVATPAGTAAVLWAQGSEEAAHVRQEWES